MNDTGHTADCCCGYCLATKKEAAEGASVAEMPTDAVNLDAMFRVMDKCPGAAALLAVALQVQDATKDRPEADFVTIIVVPQFGKLLRQAARSMYRQAMESTQ